MSPYEWTRVGWLPVWWKQRRMKPDFWEGERVDNFAPLATAPSWCSPAKSPGSIGGGWSHRWEASSPPWCAGASNGGPIVLEKFRLKCYRLRHLFQCKTVLLLRNSHLYWLNYRHTSSKQRYEPVFKSNTLLMTKFRRSRVLTRASSSRRISKLCNLSWVDPD